MRSPFVLYLALYVVLEMVGHQLSLVSWPQLTPLMVATAATDALLLVAVAVAALVTADVTRPRWQPALAAWVRARAARSALAWDDDGPIDVPSWRDEPRALPAAPARPGAPGFPPGAVSGPIYGPAFAGARPFPEDPGRLL